MSTNGAAVRLLPWLFGILGSLVTAGVIAAVSIGYSTSQAVTRIEAQMRALDRDLERQEQRTIRLEAKFDTHIAEPPGR